MKNPSDAVLFGVTIPLSARVFLTTQLNLLVDRLPNLHLVYGTDGVGPVDEIDSRVKQHVVPVLRNPSPIKDLYGLFSLIRLLRKLRPRMVVLGTPKMGMLGLLAAWILRVDRRVYILYGLRFEGASGVGRRILLFMEWLSMWCATEVIALSESNKRVSIELGLVPEKKISVIGSGSIGGVDRSRFRPPTSTEKLLLRERFELPADALVVGFLGRLVPDKGLAEMAKVWPVIHERKPDAWLLIVGPDETANSSERALIEELSGLANVKIHGPVDDPENAFGAMDINLLLTKREGFGMVLIEAAACGVPAVTTRVNGTVDAIADGVTGTLVELGDIESTAQALLAYLDSEELRARHSQAGINRVEREFDSAMVNQRWVKRYLNLLGESA